MSENNENKQNELKDLEQERDMQVTRIFWLCLEIALIILIPAVIAVIIGKYYLPSLKYLFLVFSFVISWIIIIYRYKNISRKMQNLDSKIRELRKDLNIHVAENTENYQKELDEKENSDMDKK